MRNDREQLDIILQKKRKAEYTRSKRRKFVYTSFSFFICLCIAFAVVFASRDGIGPDEEKAPVISDFDNAGNVLQGDTNRSEEDNAMQESDIKNEPVTEAPEEEPMHPSGIMGEACPDVSDKDENCELNEEIMDDANLNSSTVIAEDSEGELIEGGDETVIPDNTELYAEIFSIDYDRKASVMQKQLEELESNLSFLLGRENMGLAMAWMLYINGEDGFYHTVIQLSEEQELGALENGRFIEDGMYYCVLSYSQVLDYAAGGCKCLFVGSGLGNDEEMKVSDKEGIEVFCQLYGDMLVAQKAVAF